MPHRLTIRDEGDGRIAVYLRRAGQEFPERAGESFSFTFPLTGEEREDLRWYLEDYLIAPYAVWEDRGQATAGKLDGWGEKLFASVFGSLNTQAAYVKAREGHGGAELVIHSSSPLFLGLPWELLKDPKRPTPLALDPDVVAIDRTFDVEGEATEVPPGETLRVLMVIARPAGIDDVGYQMIARPLLERLEVVRGKVDLEVLRPPTVDALKTRLRRGAEDGRPYHILHFDGHGVVRRAVGGDGFAPTVPRDRFRHEGEGFVVFEEATGGDDPIAAEHFARIVRGGRVPLVVLNACQSGAMAEAAGAAVATRLLLEGASSVVAMGYSVYTVAAAEFMAAFYEALFEGKPVAAAVDAGRERMAQRPDRPSPKGPLPLRDWMVPVHYLRRSIDFPQLRSSSSRGGPSLDAALDRMRQAPRPEHGGEGPEVQTEGTIEPVGRFVGRDCFLYTLEVAARHDRVVLVHGAGGTGKTELAKAFGRWLRETGGLEDPDYVFFHSFEPGLPSFGLDGVVKALGTRLFGPDFIGRTGTTAQRRSIILDTLRRHRMLLVWDNLESVFRMPDPGGATPPLSGEQRQEITDFLSALRKPGGQSALILTSRTTEDWLGNVRRIALGGLTLQEASEYADDLLAPYPEVGAKREVKEFGELMEWLAGHPLSLRLILPRLLETTAEALLAGLRGMGELPLGFEAGAGRLQSLGASVKYSLDHLPDDIRRLLPALSLFEGVTDHVVLTAFSAVPEVPNRFAGASNETWQAALAETARIGLLTALSGGQYALHPALPAYLVAQWRAEAGKDFEAELQAARQALLGAHAAFGELLYGEIQSGSAGRAMAYIQRQRRTMGRMMAFALSEKRHGEAQAILQPLNQFWNARGLAAEARGWVDGVRSAVEGIGGEAPDFDSEAGALWLFAVGIEADRSRTAGDLNGAEKTYDGIRRTLEGAAPGQARDRRLAVCYEHLGIIALERGNLHAAEEWFGKSLAIRKTLDDRPGLADSYLQLGLLAQRRGDLATAEKRYRESLAMPKPLGKARSHYQLGIVAQVRSNLDAAEKSYREALAIFEALDHRLGLADCYHQLGNVAIQRAQLFKLLALGHRPGMVGSYHQLDMVALSRAQLAAAEEWYRKSLEIREGLEGRRGLADSYHQLGMVAQDRGDFPAAEEWYHKSRAISEMRGNCVGLFLTYGQLGLLSEARNDPASAFDWSVRSLELLLGMSHPERGKGIRQVARLAGRHGMATLEESWERCTGQPLPENVRAEVEHMIREEGSFAGEGEILP